MQSGLPIVADGEASTGVNAIDFRGTCADALNAAGNIFDYAWRIGKGGVIVFSKRFWHPDTLPQMHFAEMQRMAEDITRILGRAQSTMSPTDRGHMISDFYYRLSEQQKLDLRSGHRIAYSDLSSSQQSAVMAIVMNFGYGTTYSTALRLLEELNNIRNANIEILTTAAGQADDAVNQYGILAATMYKIEMSYGWKLPTGIPRKIPLTLTYRYPVDDRAGMPFKGTGQ
jgi:hypothetical protein